MQRHLFAAIVLCLALPVPAASRETGEGRWEYLVYLNGVRIGTSIVTSAVTGDRCVSTSDMVLAMGTVVTTMKQVVTETKSFEPVRCEVYQSVKNGADVTAMNTVAEFTGNTVTVRAGGMVQTHRIDGPFMLDGNYFYAQLSKKNFAAGTAVQARIYHPSIETSAAFSVTCTVLGRETVRVKERSRSLHHVAFFMESVKQADYYINDEGVAERIVQRFMNNTIELVLK
ncbi:MAG: hypothetical protein JXA20_07965 [Spirochaetes bacterium]|nr:hypothetical protein [Spirochaetota bacterium]